MQCKRWMRRRPGFTLVEMMIAMTLTVIIFALAVPFFQAQLNALNTHAGRSAAGQNAVYGVNQIDKDLRNAGVNMENAAQPMLVQAAADAITFNGDLVTALDSNLRAVYFNKEVDSAAVAALNSYPAPIQLPVTLYSYPDTTYGGDAETTSYFLEKDGGSPRGDVYKLMRSVNRLKPEIVARNILVPEGEQPFRYFKSDSVGGMREIDRNALPLIHSAKVHESLEDVGESAQTDSILMVRVRLIGLYEDARGGEMRDTVERSIRIANAGLLHLAQCGDRPIFESNVVVARLPNPPLRRVVLWDPSSDDGGAEKDVQQYAVYRRLSSAKAFSEPVAIVNAAKLTKYSFMDTQAGAGTWVYGVAALDCTPQSSQIRLSAPTP